MLLTFYAYCEKKYKLKFVSRAETSQTNKTIIYGSFIQRLGFTSGGFRQEVWIIDTLTKEKFKLNVKPSYGTRKQYAFCNHIKPGTYAILNYYYKESKWYGALITTEPIIKPIKTDAKNIPIFDSANNFWKLYYIFTVLPNKINYIGNWHFEILLSETLRI